jgi:hypothetical protein
LRSLPFRRPLTHLAPTGETEKLEVDDAVYHVVNVEPTFS